MNISDITVQNASVSNRKTAFGADSFLSIGRKGQTVEGTISKVSDRISINFNGIEVSVSGSAVQNATEGEVRKFRIMDVSKDNIVLKEVGRKSDSSSTRAMMGTTVSTGGYSFSDYLAESQGASEAKHQAGENIAVLTGEDYQSMESQEGALEEYKESVLDRAIERAKEKRQWQQERMESYHQSQQESQEIADKMQAQGFLEQKSPEQIAMALEQADLPVTDASIAKVSVALQMAQVAGNLSDDARAYLVENLLPPTIENIYHGQYSGSGGMSVQEADEDAWQQLLPQIENLLAEHGMETEQSLVQAKWLFANDLPITVETLQTLQTLDRIQGQLTADQVLEQITQAMSAGSEPQQASLDVMQFVVARQQIRDFWQISRQDVENAVQMSQGGDITLALLKQAKSNETTKWTPEVLTTQRQLEEIRLKMTLQAAVKMSDKGIDIELTPLKQLVDQLRQMENDYYKESFSEQVGEVTEEQTNLMQETLTKAEEIKRAPAAILGSSVRQQSLLTMNALHKAAVSATVQMARYQSDYEAVGTQVRTDLGDSIQKAFGNIPQLLSELGMEDTRANERAVRILGYNQMEITEQNIQQVKQQDATVNSVIEHMKPSVVLELIRQGENPLDTPLPQLDSRLQQIAREKGVTDEEKYSRYLWQLEREYAISQQERDGYIGIYRLLNQVEKTDGAAVGAVLDSRKDMTLGNLLTAVRTIHSKGVDARVDDSFGGLTDLKFVGSSISRQIENGFGTGSGQDRSRNSQDSSGSGQDSSSNRDNSIGIQEGQQTQQYYSRLVKQVLDMATPSAWQEISDGDLQRLLMTSLEACKEQLEDAKGNPALKQQMYEQLAGELRETVQQQEKAAEYLDRMHIPDTVANLKAAEYLLEQGYDVQKELYARRKVLDEKQRKEYEKALEELPEALSGEETMTQQCRKLEDYMDRILENSYEEKEISSRELQDLKLLGQGIWLQKQLTRRHSYEVPIETGDTVTSLNVTLIQGSGDRGRVQISLTAPAGTEDAVARPEYGTVSMELRIHKNEIKGLVLCDTRAGYEKLMGARQQLTDSLEQKDFTVKNLSYGMDYKSRADMAAGEQPSQEPTSRLYQAAKILVQHTIESLK